MKFTILNSEARHVEVHAPDESAARVAAMIHFHGPAPQTFGLAPQSATFPNTPRGPAVMIVEWHGWGLTVVAEGDDR